MLDDDVFDDPVLDEAEIERLLGEWPERGSTDPDLTDYLAQVDVAPVYALAAALDRRGLLHWVPDLEGGYQQEGDGTSLVRGLLGSAGVEDVAFEERLLHGHEVLMGCGVGGLTRRWLGTPSGDWFPAGLVLTVANAVLESAGRGDLRAVQLATGDQLGLFGVLPAALSDAASEAELVDAVDPADEVRELSAEEAEQQIHRDAVHRERVRAAVMRGRDTNREEAPDAGPPAPASPGANLDAQLAALRAEDAQEEQRRALEEQRKGARAYLILSAVVLGGTILLLATC